MSIDKRVFPTTGRIPQFKVLTSEPDDWGTNYQDYYTYNSESSSYVKNTNSTWAQDTYYSLDDSYDQGTSLITEYNIASLINQLLDVNGFVIEYVRGDQQSNPQVVDKLAFNIKGYYFEIEGATWIYNNSWNTESLNDDSNYVWFEPEPDGTGLLAKIKIDKSNPSTSFYRILSKDERDNNSGLGETVDLKIFENTDLKIPWNSMLHLSNRIDNGMLNSNTNSF